VQEICQALQALHGNLTLKWFGDQLEEIHEELLHPKNSAESDKG
jgi:hypothetical protein